MSRRSANAAKKKARASVSRHFVARGHRRPRTGGDRALALWPRPPLPPYVVGEPLAVRVVYSSWQTPPLPPKPQPAKRGSPEWRAKVSAGTRAKMKAVPKPAPSRFAVSGIGRRPGFVVSEATRAKMRAAALRRYGHGA